MEHHLLIEAPSPARFSVIANAIEDALARKERRHIDSIHQELSELVRQLLGQARPSVVTALSDKNSIAPEREAFILGQAMFAQMLAGQAVTKRAEDCFLDKLHLPRFKPYVEALSKRDLTNSELSEEMDEDVATVSRKLRELRECGIADFVRRGTNVVNFLTPLAIEAFSPGDTMSRDVAAVLSERERQIPAFMRSAKNFGSVAAVEA